MKRPPVYFMGPSGAGKTYLVSAVNRISKAEGRLYKAVDTDMFGYRTHPDRWKEWILVPEIFGVYRQLHDNWDHVVVLAGASSNLKQVLDTALSLRFAVKVILPRNASQLAWQRRDRGDTQEKISDAGKSYLAWKAIADQHSLEVGTAEQHLRRLLFPE